MGDERAREYVVRLRSQLEAATAALRAVQEENRRLRDRIDRLEREERRPAVERAVLPPSSACDPARPSPQTAKADERGASLTLLAWWLAVLIAFIAQQELFPPRRLGEALALFGMAVVLFIGGAPRIDRLYPSPDPSEASRDPPGAAPSTWQAWLGWRGGPATVLTIGGCLLLAAVVYGVAASDLSPVLLLLLWLLAMGLLAAGLAWGTTYLRRVRLSRQTVMEILVVGTIVGVAFALRFADLTRIPADVHGDEGAIGLEARRILTGRVANFFGLGWASLPELSFVASAASMRVFGDDLFGLRMASVIQGCLSVGVMYAFAKRLYSIRVAVLAAIIMATAQMQIHYSRSGLTNIQALLVSLLFLYFLLRGLQTNQPVDFLIAGFAAGLTLCVYVAARLTPVVALIYLTYRSISEPGFLQRRWRGLMVLVAGFAIFLAPVAAFYVSQPWRLFDRTSAVFLLQPNNLAHEYDAYHVHSVLAVLEWQVAHTLAAFNLRGETSQHYGQTAPLLDAWTGALFVLGAALITSQWRRARSLLLASWLWLTLLLGSVLTVDALDSTRVIVVLAVTALAPALVIDAGWRATAGRLGIVGSRFFAAFAVVLLLVAARANVIDYFTVHVRTMEPEGFYTVLSHYVLTVNGRYRVYLLGNHDVSLRYDTIHFLVPRVDGINLRDRPLSLPLAEVPERKGVVFIVTSRRDPRLTAIEAHYPGGDVVKHTDNLGAKQFYSYRVERAQLLAANPAAVVVPAVALHPD